jgi:hypothetical protein
MKHFDQEGRKSGKPLKLHRPGSAPPLRPPRLCGSLFHPKNQDNRRVAKAAEGSQSRNGEAFFDQEGRKAGKPLKLHRPGFASSSAFSPSSAFRFIQNPPFLRASSSATMTQAFLPVLHLRFISLF